MLAEDRFRILLVHLDRGTAETVLFGSRAEMLGGSGLAAPLFETYGLPGEGAHHPDQPLIFAVGPLTGFFPLMSKVVCAFLSPYHGQYAESHAGGRLALALRFAGFDALVLRGRCPSPSCLCIGPGRQVAVDDAHYLWGKDVFETGKLLRTMYSGYSGHRSIARIGPAGENGLAYGCINVDTYRHFGRLGAGSVMGGKNLKAIVVRGDEGIPLPAGDYPKVYEAVYKRVNGTEVMKKYHDLGTPQNLRPLNTLRALPWRNLRQSADPGVEGISGERFAADFLLRQSACSGCPVGCIHIGLLREQFAGDSHFLYHQVNYDHEPIFAGGTMLGITEAGGVMGVLDEVEKAGMDIMSAGVALAWATEARERGLVGDAETLVPLAFGNAATYRRAVPLLARGETDFYRLLGQGTAKAAARYGGLDFACVLGQEMAGYATGEAFFTAQALGFRHSHLDSAGYTFDQVSEGKDPSAAVEFLVEDERNRCLLTSMVVCLFARNAYPEEVLADCLRSLDGAALADRMAESSRAIQKARWRQRFATGYDPDSIIIPKRFTEVINWKGPVDAGYLEELRKGYGKAIRGMGTP